MHLRLSCIMLVCIALIGFQTPTVYAGHGGNCGSSSSYDKGIKNRFFGSAGFFLEQETALGLSEAQVDQIENLKRETKKLLIQHDAHLKVNQIDLSTALSEGRVDRKSVQKLLDQQYEIKRTMERSLAEAYADLQEVLSEEQHQQAKNLIKATRGSDYSHNVYCPRH